MLGVLHYPVPGRSIATGLFRAPSMNDSLEVEVLYQPDSGEGLAKRKEVVAKRGLKKAWSKAVARWTRTG
jgi:hypothetical protein